ncbi:hypothetical protein JYU34_001040 [Plutella xylostella]|uniref:Uncharacterized protein n=1 Tax=Plutella xylostella TaxID=51655 RepID=A0ABQ7R5U6_PLUXY|nr:hypothetical protein JYU34_001040 [Plutella xylostella]
MVVIQLSRVIESVMHSVDAAFYRSAVTQISEGVYTGRELLAKCLLSVELGVG